jgi:hypothetical protein
MQEIHSFDDVDDDDIMESNTEDDNVSKYCIAIYNASNNTAIGSGVLLDSQGMFISAGHNFKNSEVNVKAYFGGKCYDVKLSYYKYDRDRLLDFAVGFLSKFDTHYYSNDVFPSLGSCSDLHPGSEVNAVGYKSSILNQAELIESINPAKDLRLYKQRKTFDIVNPDESQKIIFEELNGQGMFYMELQQAHAYVGFSGGPIYNDNIIYGIIISDYFLKSDYIKEILERNQEFIEKFH